jgi:hypothetical protein
MQSFFAEKPGNKKEDRNTSPETTMFLRGKFEKSKGQILSEKKQYDTICQTFFSYDLEISSNSNYNP